MCRETVLLLALLLSSAPAVAAPQPAAVMLYPGIDITTWPDAPFRWKDIATTVYASEYQSSYGYAQAQVRVVFDPGPALTFSGHLSADNLKPNFAYQMKLVGKPTALWGAAGDDASNANMGYTGRWWRYQPDPGNSSDAEVAAHAGDPDWIFEGYLLFDFFVTDSQGDAEVDFALDSSFHVLWWQHQRTPGACDSPVLWHTVVGHAEDLAYTDDVGPLDVGVYAEIERLCDGESRLPPSDYNCRFLITEESFHQSGGVEGYWASAMVNDELAFSILDPTAAPAATGAGTLDLGGAWPNPGHGSVAVAFQLGVPSPVEFTIHDATGRRLRCLSLGCLPPGAHSLVWDGKDEQGRSLPAGLYLYRLAVPAGLTRGGKLVLMR
jgi:hypothetical protein